MFVHLLCMKLTLVSAAEVRCIERERQALLKFKLDLVDDYGLYSSWGSEEVKKDCCKWNGVSCSNVTGHVELLELVSPYNDRSHLKAKLSPSLLELQYLNYLELSFIDFGGSEIPRFIGSFNKLSYLRLRSSNFTGEVPREIGNLTNLRFLDIGDNNLRIENLECLSHPSSLSYLGLNGVSVINQTSWLHHITRFPFLEELYLSGCQIPNPVPSFDIFTNSSLSHLSVIDLSFNNLTSSFAFHWLFNSSASLTRINLSFNQLEGPIPDAFGELIFLEVLCLDRNKFHGSISHLCTIPKDLNISILMLDLSDNKLEGELPNCWMNMRSLVLLDLANNKFSGKIPHTLGTLDRLEILHLRDNNFIGELPSTLRNCVRLRTLDVGGNKLTGNIPAWIGTDLTNLTLLSLRFNEFDGIMPSTICRLTNTHVLDLSRNNISGRISRCLNNFTALVQKNSSIEEYDYFKIYAFQDNVDMHINNAFVQWKGQGLVYKTLGLLKGIDLSGNELVGTIPQEIFVLRGLIFLNLSRNHLTGNIISDIGQMEMLESIDLSRNQLSGEIPNSLADLNFLSVLDLSYNNFTGKIPSSTQLQSFNSSTYAENSQLCGKPLAECPGDISNGSTTGHKEGNSFGEDDGFITLDFYICMAFGFITGFWVVVTTLVLKHSWRHSYFNCWNSVGNWMYVTTIYVTRFKRKFLE
ncbi:receptor 12 [Olea europaea subsp. europaea]|uniref:Receptor 12 n=1 Tax=Olea europaea subsp. europaea TaxID=158383 RepID=A0A8S0PKI1_OLEEU|nr:receptor 12 [Olea europaea subsp. europaea]